MNNDRLLRVTWIESLVLQNKYLEKPAFWTSSNCEFMVRIVCRKQTFQHNDSFDFSD